MAKRDKLDMPRHLCSMNWLERRGAPLPAPSAAAARSVDAACRGPPPQPKEITMGTSAKNGNFSR